MRGMSAPVRKPTPRLDAALETIWLEGPVAVVFKATATGAWRVERPVIEATRCNACGECQKYCPADLITYNEGFAAIDYTYCKGCGICASICSRQAIRLVPEEG